MRSPSLVPVLIAALTVATAAILHRTHPGTWPWLAAATAGGVALLAAPLPEWARKAWDVLDRPAERVYVAAVTAASGGWLTAATVIGPAIAPMPAVAVALTVVCGIPWWASRRRRAKVRVDRLLESWPEIAKAVGLAGSQVMSALVDVWGWRARLRLARGQTINDVIAKVPGLESGLGTFRGAVRVYPTPDDLANRCELRVLDIDPHADAIEWPGPSAESITEPIELGPFEDAEPCWQAHTLNAPGKFLIAAAEHDTPKRARAYLVTDEAVVGTAARYADFRPPLDEVSQHAIEENRHAERQGVSPNIDAADADAPDVILWAALSLATDDGASVPELMAATGMSRPWIYQRLRDLARQGQVTKVSRGRWRTVIGDIP